MLPAGRPLEPIREAARFFGRKFAEDMLKLTPGHWDGPLESPYGLHIVLVREKIDGTLPRLEDIRPVVEREFLADNYVIGSDNHGFRGLTRLGGRYRCRFGRGNRGGRRRDLLIAIKDA